MVFVKHNAALGVITNSSLCLYIVVVTPCHGSCVRRISSHHIAVRRDVSTDDKSDEGGERMRQTGSVYFYTGRILDET